MATSWCSCTVWRAVRAAARALWCNSRAKWPIDSTPAMLGKRGGGIGSGYWPAFFFKGLRGDQQQQDQWRWWMLMDRLCDEFWFQGTSLQIFVVKVETFGVWSLIMWEFWWIRRTATWLGLGAELHLCGVSLKVGVGANWRLPGAFILKRNLCRK